jgi:two-component system, OmpR family, sensor kinase
VTLIDSPNLAGLGRIVRERRAVLRLTQTQLAERLGWVQERISLLENGKYGMPSLQALIRLTEALEMPFADLLEAAGYSGIGASLPSEVQRTTEFTSRYALQRLLAIQAQTLKGALDEASDLLVQTMGADKIDAFIYEQSSESLVALGTSNTPMGRRQHELGLNREPLANGGRVVQVFQTGRSFYTPQADADPEMTRGVVHVLGVRSFLAVPLRPTDAITGVLCAESAQPNRFSRDERDFFEAATRWVAMVARRAELTETLTRVAAEDARRLAAEELVTLLAHDLGNALTPVKGRLDMMNRRYEREERQRDLEDVRELGRGLGRVQAMVRGLLDVARIDQGIFAISPQPVDLVSLVEDAANAFRPIHPTIVLRLPDELPIHADPSKVTQVLENLITNAIKHSPDSGDITIAAGTETRDDGTWAVVSVHDDGPGVAPEIMPTLFTRFASSGDSSGLGLGLYLARSIAEAHGGTLTVESAPGKGASFWLSLPVLPRRHHGSEGDGNRSFLSPTS